MTGREQVSASLVYYEMANTARKKIAAQPESRFAVSAAFRGWLNLPIRTLSPDFAVLADLALSTDLTVYDATYLQLALRHGLELLTFDAALNDAYLKMLQV